MMTLRLDAGLGAKDVRTTPRRNPGLISAAHSTRDTYMAKHGSTGNIIG